jgi:hAT family C-terminal dimerisation region
VPGKPDINKLIQSATAELPQHELSENVVAAEEPLQHEVAVNVFTADASNTPSEVEPEPDVFRRKPQNQSLWERFDVTPLPGKFWQPKRGKGPVEDREIQCKLCKWKTTDSARATSTTNMIRHLAQHKIFLNTSESPQDGDDITVTQHAPPTLSSFFLKQSDNAKAKGLERNLMRWVVEDHMAFDTIESTGFQRIFKDLAIPLPFRSRMTMSRRIDKEFESQRAQLINELSLTCQTIGLSLDIWTSKNFKAILGVIGHWLTADFQYQERVLEFTEMHSVHSGENMAQTVEEILEELGIRYKLLAITTDNASNNETLVSELFFNLSTVDNPEQLRFLGLDSFIRCAAHVLNLIVTDILSDLKAGEHSSAMAACDLLQQNKDIGEQSALARLRIIALWIGKTPQRREQWKVVCQSNRLKDNFIEYDVDTRWNSTYRMLRDGIKAKQQIKKWMDQCTSFTPFTPDDWSYLQQTADFLARFEEFTLTVSKRKPRITLALPIYYELHDFLNDAASKEGEFSDLHPEIVKAASAGLKKFQKYYDLMDRQDTYYIAIILDPRFKTRLLEKELATAHEVIGHIKEWLHRQYPCMNQGAVDQPTTQPPATPATKRIEARLLEKVQPSVRSRSDIDRYFEDDIVIFDSSETEDHNWLLSWWKEHSGRYPRMAAAARDYLPIPASSVSVERLFSGGRDLLGVRRSALKGETMRRLMLLQDTYKNFE